MKYSSINVSSKEELETMQKISDEKPNITNIIINKWQDIIDLISLSINVPSVLIMNIEEQQINIFLKSNSKDNSYKKGEKVDLFSSLYSETAALNNAYLLVQNALTDTLWGRDLNMISYLGFPIVWPDGEVFGTICALDNKENHYNNQSIKLMELLIDSIEKDLQLILEEEMQYKKLIDENERMISETIELEKSSLEFFANISHEMRTPLNIILGSIQIIMMMIQDNEKPINKSKII